jgi:hypothetical protein
VSRGHDCATKTGSSEIDAAVGEGEVKPPLCYSSPFAEIQFRIPPVM